MSSTRKNAGLGILFLFVFILIPSIGAQHFSGAELLFEEEFFFFEELFLFEEPFVFDESLSSEEPFLTEEPFPYDEDLFSEEPLRNEASSSEEIFLSEESFFDDEDLLSEEPIPDEEPLLSEDIFFDDESFVFQASDLIFEVPTFETRSFDEIFPNLSRIQRRRAMSNVGLRNSFEKDSSPMLLPDPNSKIDLLSIVMEKKPSHIIEALLVVPYKERELDMLDIYNALGRIENIKDHSISVNGNDIYIFTESTRLESARNRRSISDPSPAVLLPFSDTIYLRIKDAFFGNLFLRGDISISLYGITYSMTNFTDVRYFLLPVMKAGRFSAIIYLEPIQEGILIYSMSGFYIPGFIADRVNLTPNINGRIAVFISWITDGLRRQE
ncbi:MAG: hypothetical protein LBQ93_09520 [Treponema sp.]|nr:hypothetical protein [Treponema sp.]